MVIYRVRIASHRQTLSKRRDIIQPQMYGDDEWAVVVSDNGFAQSAMVMDPLSGDIFGRTEGMQEHEHAKRWIWLISWDIQEDNF
jgi:hypothetical protein